MLKTIKEVTFDALPVFLPTPLVLIAAWMAQWEGDIRTIALIITTLCTMLITWHKMKGKSDKE